MNGIINILKPPNMTSHDVVGLIRRTLKIKKVGHTGTLDPMACGVLPICVGQATKVSQYLLNDRKKYRCEMVLGSNTDTQDRWGTIVHERPVNVDEEQILGVFEEFKGEILQTPPMYSALKKDGRKLYELAREGKTVERKSRKIYIYNIEVIRILGNNILFDVECSKGTYVRTICEDVGNKLGCGAHMTFLLRTQTGGFHLEDTVTIEDIERLSIEELEKEFYPLDYPIQSFPKVLVHDWAERFLLNGNTIYMKNIKENDELKEDDLVRMYSKDKFIAIGRVKKDKDNNVYIDTDRVFH
ncbi:tRNA pseudouridine(55) synthase TruB [Anaeromicrobium sediminis]|uniref:tRNA pseudouridine synthase B n=1 Tax=Anaeromicrobium sediminis TaxID=1478221 RepID=A0A267MP83_9FIRM|nr:tRNA pseudouridine(55) synthase TruB [Anaeromicrobium sediminis]PAB61222.1 tRNA pseudouridine(55) synthase TruB [Anaeromicrobium sediminis]